MKKRKWTKQIKDIMSALGIILIYSCIITSVSLYYSTSSYGLEMFRSYLKFDVIFWLHFSIVFFIIIILYFLLNRLFLACGLGSIIIMGFTWVNYFKLQLRDDPFLFGDLLIVSEATNMVQNYKVRPTIGMILCVLAIVISSIVLFYVKKKIFIKPMRWVLFALSLIMAGTAYKTVYTNGTLYESIENYDLVSRWGDTQRFVSRGFLYPFVYSVQSAFPNKPDDYNKKDVEDVLAEYTYSDISEDKKVNIIGIMLEAYNDFSKFEGIQFERDPYEYWHELQKESYSGELTANIFAGGTVNTERGFLTGYTSIPNMRKTTNTYVQYFKEQGYDTLGRHQCYEWFYNRKNANEYMGFDEYHFYEDAYSDYNMGDLIKNGDMALMSDIISDFQKESESGNKKFHFSVTYQNHGPYYAGAEYSEPYLKWDDKYNENEYIIANNYFEGVHKTGLALKELIDYFRVQEEPVVIILFGDHNPWLGDNNSIYEMLEISLDLDTKDGFFNYYNTPYVIWGNQSAKDALGKDIIGEGRNISPCFLMNELFDVLGYEGNEYMKYTSNLRDNFPVLHSSAYVKGNEFIRTLSEDDKKTVSVYPKVQYYWIYDKK